MYIVVHGLRLKLGAIANICSSNDMYRALIATTFDFVKLIFNALPFTFNCVVLQDWMDHNASQNKNALLGGPLHCLHNQKNPTQYCNSL